MASRTTSPGGRARNDSAQPGSASSGRGSKNPRGGRGGGRAELDDAYDSIPFDDPVVRDGRRGSASSRNAGRRAPSARAGAGTNSRNRGTPTRQPAKARVQPKAVRGGTP